MPTSNQHLKRGALALFLCFFAWAGSLWAQPQISFSQNQIDTSLSTCNDTLLVPITIYNTGSSQLDLRLYDGRFHHDFMYAAHRTGGRVSKSSYATNTMVDSAAGGDWPRRLELNPDATELWVSDRDKDSVLIYRTSDMTLIGAFNTAGRPSGISCLTWLSRC